jgi:RHS repeat-associated protein
VSLEASTSDPDVGDAVSVRYFIGGTPISPVLTVAPYLFDWTTSVAGAYSIVARATDQRGASTDSAPLSIMVHSNRAPTVSVTSPATDAAFTSPATVLLEATASDPDAGDSVKVRFFSGPTPIGPELAAAPYRYEWPSVAAGAYTITARATDTSSAVTTSAPLLVTVNPRAPTIRFLEPAVGAQYVAPATVALIVEPTVDPSRTVTRVDFVSATQSIGGASAPPYRLNVIDLGVGSHVYTAVVHDSGGATASTFVTFNVVANAAPTVTLTAPLNNGSFVAPAAITLSATAADSDGTIQRVEFRRDNGTTWIQNGIAGPNGTYTYSWTGVAAGTFNVIARAIDNRGASTDSAPITITVRTNSPPTSAQLIRPLVTAKDLGIGYGNNRFNDNVFASNQIMTVEAIAIDDDGNIDRIEFYRNDRNPANRLATIRPPTAGLSAFHGSARVALNSAMESQTMQTVFAVAFDSNGAELTSSRAPVAITRPNVASDGCAGIGPCTGTSHAIPGRIDAERYDRGGAGIAYFDVDPYNGVNGPGAVPPTWINPRSDDVDVRQCPDGQLVSDCAVGSNVMGEWQTYSLQFGSPSGLYDIYLCWVNNPRGSGSSPQAPGPATGTDQPLTLPISFQSAHGGDPIETQATLQPIADPSTFLLRLTAAASSSTPLACDGVVGGAALPYQFPADYRGWMTVFVSGTWGALIVGNAETDWIVLVPSGSIPQTSVSIAQPEHGADFQRGTPVRIVAGVQSPNPSSTVSFYYRTAALPTIDRLIGTDSISPFEVTWTPPDLGGYTLLARVSSGGVTASSAPVSISVSNSPANQAPTATLLQPSSGTVAPGAALSLRASASDPDGTVSRVEFLVRQNGTIMGSPIAALTDPGAPGQWTATWVAPLQGSYQLSARAFDSATPASSGESASATISVQAGPILGHETPVDVPGVIDPASDGVGATAGTFRVDESGAANYSIALATVPGRAGVAPELSLNYSSLGSNGPLGRGWSLGGASSIARCRQTREHGDVEAAQSGSAPISFTAEDRFCLDGQRLLLVAGSAYGANGSEYRTELDSFARIRAYDPDGVNGPNYFVVQRKDGTTAWYGDRIDSADLPFMIAGSTSVSRPDAVVLRNNGDGATQPAGNAPVLSWAMSRNMDSFGNYVDHVYSTDMLRGEQLLAEVRYTGKTRLNGQAASPGDQPPFAFVRFNYQSLPVTEQTVGYVSGMRVGRSRFLASVASLSGPTTIRHYRLSYGTSVSGSAERLLTQLQECADESPGAVCYRPTTFTWSSAQARLTSEFVGDVPDTTQFKSSKLGDVDGDGRLDLVWFENQPALAGNCPVGLPSGTQRIWTHFATVTTPNGALQMERSPGQRHACSWRPYRSNIDDAWFLVDFNGDGRDDLMIADEQSAPAGGEAVPRWHVYPSRGRANNAQVFDQSVDLLASCAGNTATVGCVPIPGSNATLAQIADVNGDGLPDVYYAAPSATAGIDVLRVKLMERNGVGYRFSIEHAVTIDWGASDQCSQPIAVDPEFGARQFLGCALVFANSDARGGRSPQPIDMNGDGRADLLLKVRQRFSDPCVSNCPPPPSPETVADAVFFSARKPEDLTRLQSAGALRSRQSSSTTRILRNEIFHYALVATRITPAGAGAPPQLILTRYASRLSALENLTTPAENSVINGDPTPADINGDGLTDVLWRVANDTQLLIDINNGSGLNGGTTLSGISGRKHLQVVDFNADGRADLIHTSNGDNAGNYLLRLAAPDGTYPAASSTLPGGNVPDLTPRFWLQHFADIDGDGAIDFLGWKLSGDSGPGDSNDNYRSIRGTERSGADGGDRYQPRDVVTAITNGYGAVTRIRYQPLTNGAVYVRDTGSRDSLNYGRGSAVQDMLAPFYVVSQVESDAPGLDAPNRTSQVFYQYRGARLQGGGRGLLGFREVRSIDGNFPDQYVVTITEYAQAFPHIGMALETRKYLVAGSYAPSSCQTAGPEAAPASCFNAGGSTVNTSFAEPVGRLISYARNRFGELDTAGPAGQSARFPFIAASFEAAGHVDIGALAALSETVSAFQYDNFGNVLLNETGTAVGTFYADLTALRNAAEARLGATSATARCGANCLTRSETLASYAPADTTYWRLGRLTDSTVTHSRTGVPNVVRTSSFSYDMTSTTRTGVLLSERVQAGIAFDQDLRTVRFYDDFGNVATTLSCSANIAVADCDSADDVSKVKQRPAGQGDAPLSSVYRYTRTVYDPSGRYADESRAPYFLESAANQANEQFTQRVTLRDLLGNTLRSEGPNNTWATAAFGPLGRQQRSEDATGARTATEFHWCRGINAGAREADCPVGAVFRQTSYARGGQRAVTYFDKLGRKFYALGETFNRYDAANDNDWVAACTTYDARGRTVAVSEPHFVIAAGNAGLPGVAVNGSICAGAPSTRTRYDALDRVLEIQLPEHTPGSAAHTVMTYDGHSTTTRTQIMRDESGDGVPDPVVMNEVRLKDAAGLVIRVTDNDGLVADYLYDAIGNATSISRDAGRGLVVSSVTYDALGRKVAQSDPDAGASSYRYNAAGEEICAADARGFRTLTDLDALGRIWRVRNENGSCTPTTVAETRTNATLLPSALPTGTARSLDVTFFDSATNGRGLPASSHRRHTAGDNHDQTGSFSQSTSYDTLGRPLTVTTTLRNAGGGEESYTQSTSYDSLGRVATSTDATGGMVENMYSAHGFLRRVRDGANRSQLYWELFETDARGQTTRDQRHGNVSLTSQRRYDSTSGRLQTIRSGAWTGSALGNAFQDLAYSFDAQGNLLTREDARLRLRESFRYDRLNRLLSAAVRDTSNPGASVITSIALRYDKLGNICEKNGRAYTIAGASGCGVGGVPGAGGTIAGASPHAVTQRATSTGFVTYAHDAAGNQIAADDSTGTATDRQVRYDSEGLADRITVGAPSSPTSVTHFRYAAGGRYLRVDIESGLTTTTRYLGGVEWLTKPDGSSERKRYIGGFLMLVETGATSAPTRQHRYLFTDHLGSLDVITNEQGNVLERLSFDAHGARRIADGATSWVNGLASYVATNTKRGFTGHEHIDAAGIVHMNGRLYDAVLGRMLSPDPIVQEPFNSQNLNRYSYVLNNPLSFTDPSGLSFVKKYWRQLVSTAITIFAPYLGAWTSTWWGAMSIGFVSGAVSSGSLQGGLWGAFSAGLFHGIGTHFADVAGAKGTGFLGSGLTDDQFAAKVLAHGVAGGVMSTLQGGKFGHGFASAGVAQAFAPGIDRIDAGNTGFSAARVAAAALVGGTASVASGGKFANGAVTSAFAYAFNDAMHRKSAREAARDQGEELLGPYVSGYDPNDPNYHRYEIGPTELCTVGDRGCSFDMTASITASKSVPFVPWYSGPGAYDLPDTEFPWVVGNPINHRTPERGVWVNDTSPGHRYHPGSVAHGLYQSRGRMWLYTIGAGTGPNPAENISNGNWIFGGMHGAVRHQVARAQIFGPGY